MFSPPGEARRSVGSVQERIRPGIPDETSSWRWGEPAPPPHLHFIFIFTFKTRREDPVFSKQAKWLIWGYNLVIMCHFWDCSVGNSHLKAFFTSSLDGTAGSSMVYADSRASAFWFFFCFFSVRHIALRLRVSVSSVRSFNTAAQCRFSAHAASQWATDTDLPVKSSHCSGVLYPSVLVLWFPVTPRKTTSAGVCYVFRGIVQAVRLAPRKNPAANLNVPYTTRVTFRKSPKSWHHQTSVCDRAGESRAAPCYLTSHGIP